jgi:hypothetical protein
MQATTRDASRIGSAIDRSIHHTTRYTQLSAAPFKDFWDDDRGAAPIASLATALAKAQAERRTCEIRLRTERKAAQLLAKIPKANGKLKHGKELLGISKDGSSQERWGLEK